MERLPMCRMCLSENVRLGIVASRNLHELYEKLTDIPFVTEDSRPKLACVFCCAKLNQCYRLMRQYLQAENFFAQRMNDKSEPNSIINENRSEVFGGLMNSPVKHINIDSHIAVEEDFSAVCDGPDNVMEPKKEYHSDELEPENLDNSCQGAAGVPHYYELDLEYEVPLLNCKTEVEDEEVSKCNKLTIKLEPEDSDNSCPDVAGIPPRCHESDLEDDVPLINCKTEVEDEDLSKKKSSTQTIKLEPEDSDNSCPDVAGIPPRCYESDLEDDVPLINCKTEVEDEEMSKNKSNLEAIKATLARSSKQDTRRIIEKDAITAEHTTKDKSDPKVIRTAGKCMFKSGTYFKEPYTHHRPGSDKVKKEYNCDVSQGNYMSKLTDHGEKRYQCNICQRNFSQQDHLTIHVRTHTGEKPHKCNVCQRCFSRKSHLTRHMNTHTGEKPYECNVCQRCFSRKSNLTRHILTHTGEKPYECDFCQRSFVEKSKLAVHICVHTGEKPYECNICNRYYGHKKILTLHMRTHTGETPHKCNVCQRCFSRKSHLTRHILTHTGEKPYECDFCQRSFIEKSKLAAHIRVHTGEKPYECNICNRNYGHKKILTLHMRTHTGEKPYKCHVCHRNFPDKSNLKQHMRTHTGEKPYQCTFCQRNFAQKSTLRMHMRTHTDEKPYQCDFCQRNFRRNGHLKQHMLTHTGDKPYECNYCERKFGLKKNLTQHTRTHTGEKPYKCDLCERYFSEKNKVTKHMRTHTGKKPIKCHLSAQL